MTKDEALRLALEALTDALDKPMWNRVQMESAITSIKAALEAKGEPVAWLCCVQGQDAVLLFDEPSDEQYPPKCKEPLYTTPPQRKPLTDEEIYTEARNHEKFAKDGREWFDRGSFARAIEAKLKEKNT